MSRFEIYKVNDSGEKCWCWKLFDHGGKHLGTSKEVFVKGSIIPSIKKIKGQIQVKFDETIIEEIIEWTSNSDGKRQIEDIKKIILEASIVWENECDDPAYQHKHDDRTEPHGIPGS